MRIVVLGPPGAGKGTQSRVMAQRINLPHISTGDILRRNVKDDTDLGRKAKGYMEKGELVPDTLVTEMLARRLDEKDTQKGFILDGYPRNIKQAEALEGILKDKRLHLDFVFYLNTSEPVIIQRLTGRLVCKKCGANFHIKNMPPKVSMVCDNCRGELYQRSDDNEKTVRNRIKVYKKEVSALIDYYRKGGKLRSVPADEEAEVVLEKMLLIVKE